METTNFKIEIIDPNTITLADLGTYGNELYTITVKAGRYKSVSIDPLTIGNSKNGIIIRLIENNEEPVDIQPIIEEEPAKENPKNMRTWTRLSYKVDEYNPKGDRYIMVRPDGEIRISFKEKDDATTYWEYFRDQFYRRTNDVDAITVDSIYNEIGIVNYDKDKCSEWGWLTINYGINRYISEMVTKIRGTDMYGFSLKRPVKLYGINKKEETA